MNIKTVTTVDGVNAVDFGAAASRFYWFRNIGTSAVYVSGNSDITAGGDGVAELAVGNSVCVEALGGKIYVLGAGKVEIYNTGDKFCPFKNAPAQSGGGTVDGYTKSESDARYAQKAEIPTELPANGGTADNISGIIILTGENIKAASVEGAVKWACVDNTTANTDGFVIAGIWFKNNLSYAVTAQIIAYANQKTPTVQAGYGTGTFQEMFYEGHNREWYSNNTLETTPTPINMVVPAGKTGYFAFNNTKNDVYAVIDDANVFTTVTTRFM